MFISGCAHAGRYTVGFVYSFEFLAPKWHVWFGTLYLLACGFMQIYTGVYFWFISKSYNSLALMSGCLGFITMLSLFSFLPESPLWLIKVGKRDDGIRILKRLMRFN